MNIWVEKLFRDKFQSEEVAIQSLIGIWFDDGKVSCPHCGFSKKIYRTNRGYWCANTKCWKKFHIKTGTLLHNTKIPIRMVLEIIFTIIKDDGVVPYQFIGDYWGITYRSIDKFVENYGSIVFDSLRELKNSPKSDVFYLAIKKLYLGQTEDAK